MFLLGTLILTNCLIQTFKFLHIVMRALNLSVAADAYLSRITPNGRGDTLVIHDVASCRTSFADPYSKNVFYSFNRYCEYNICSLLDYLAIFIHVENNTIQIDYRIHIIQRSALPFFRDWQDLISYPGNHFSRHFKAIYFPHMRFYVPCLLYTSPSP